jgi:hypothetical protein
MEKNAAELQSCSNSEGQERGEREWLEVRIFSQANTIPFKQSYQKFHTVVQLHLIQQS